MNNKHIRAIRAAFPHTIPILTGFMFLGLTYGIYMNVSGFSFWYPCLISLFVFAGSALPAAVFGLLVVYCLKDVSILSGSHGVPEAIAVLAVAALHIWKKQMLLSIAGGTVCYMLLVQFVF